jgi:hypothetical protein
MARRLTTKQLEQLRSYRSRKHTVVGRDAQSSALYMRGLVSLTGEVTAAGTTVLEADDRDRAALERTLAAQAETRRIVATGVCPTCGGALKRNLSLAGWYQCEQLGAVGFRKDASKPSCSWQGFTQ